MQIRLTIADQENMDDGGPTDFTAGHRGFEIGRDAHLDWSLPDQDRVVSSVHCRVTFENGAYMLTDVSKNGTYVNGSSARVRSPYRLVDGDRLQIGRYFVDVAISGGTASRRPAQEMPPSEPPQHYGDIWSVDETPADPVDRRLFVDEQRSRRVRPRGDAMDDFVELPPISSPAMGPADESPFGSSGPGSRLNEQLRGVRGSNIDERARGRNDHVAPYPSARAPAAPQQRAMPQGQQGQQDLFAILCEAAGIPADALQRRSGPDVAAELGAVLKVATEQAIGLLRARAAAKRATKADRTMVGVSQNNALKLAPTAAEALSIMIGRTNPGYLDAVTSFREGFEDIKSHEVATYAAMQTALARLMEDFSPDKIEQKTGSGVLGSKKARAWEIYTEQWSEKQASENGVIDVFLEYFRTAYDKADKG